MQSIIQDLYKKHDETLFLTGFDLMVINAYQQNKTAKNIGGEILKHGFKDYILQLHRKHCGGVKSAFRRSE